MNLQGMGKYQRFEENPEGLSVPCHRFSPGKAVPEQVTGSSTRFLAELFWWAAGRGVKEQVTRLSRNDAGLRPILSENTFEIGFFAMSIAEPCRKLLDQLRESGRLC